jgi:ATP-grasp domain
MLPTFIKFATSRRFVAADDDETKKRKNNKNSTGKSCCVASSEPEIAAPVPLLPEVTVPTDDGAAPGPLLLVSGSGHDESLSSSLVTPSPETKTVFSTDNESASIVSSISDQDLIVTSLPSPSGGVAGAAAAAAAAAGSSNLASSSSFSSFRVEPWDKKTHYSAFVRDAIQYLKKRPSNSDDASAAAVPDSDEVVMLFESPSSASADSTFFNCQVYKFHDWPPMSAPYKTMLGPCRYSMMNGDAYPSYLEAGAPPPGLMEHWEATVPGFVRPHFVSHLPESAAVYAYLPCESIANHVNDPHVHYHLAGKDALHLMTHKTTKRFNSTKPPNRPCIAKVTHSMASKGIFVIRNDDDEAEFEEFLAMSGNPNFVVTEFVDIERNVACHFFIHPNGTVTWFGSNENHKEADGRWSMDSFLISADQDRLREMQLPYVMDVVQYCLSVGFWGFCGIDVLFDKDGKGYMVDVNPRVTGSCPSLMVAQLLQDVHPSFEYGLFRRNGNITYRGSASQLLDEVAEYNAANEGSSMLVLFGLYEEAPTKTKINIAVYGTSLEDCRVTLNHFAQAAEPTM